MEHVPNTDDPLVDVRDLVFGYDSVPVLEQINLAVYPGEFVALIGQNGAGKTTLAKHFNGIHKPGSGSVLVKGLDTRQQSVAELAVHVGYCYQNPDHQIFSATVREELEFGLTTSTAPAATIPVACKTSYRPWASIVRWTNTPSRCRKVRDRN